MFLQNFIMSGAAVLWVIAFAKKKNSVENNTAVALAGSDSDGRAGGKENAADVDAAMSVQILNKTNTVHRDGIFDFEDSSRT